MTRSCEGKVAFVAGASQFGTGTGSVVRLAAEGAKVAFCARDEAKMAATAAEVAAVGGECVYWQCDLTDPDGGRDTLIQRTEDAFGPVDHVVYVAAGGPYAKFETITQDMIQKALEINVKAPYLIFQHAIASMRARGSGGAIVSIGTKAAYFIEGPDFLDIPPHTAGTLYGGTKAALHRMTQGLAAEVKADNISVNCVRPVSAIGTPALKASGWIPEEVMEPPEAMVEAVLACLTGDPQELTGRDVASIALLHELGRPVYDWTGTTLVEGWQPADLPAYMKARETPIVLPLPTA